MYCTGFNPQIEGPRPIGGWCLPSTKECGTVPNVKCIQKHEVCEGKCERNQCLAENKTSCLEMYQSYLENKLLYNSCDDHCIEATEQCKGKCGPGLSWESSSKQCLSPKFDRTKNEIRKGIYVWKDCDGKCIKSHELCHESCGDPGLFCWSHKLRKCLSVKEKKEAQQGLMVRIYILLRQLIFL